MLSEAKHSDCFWDACATTTTGCTSSRIKVAALYTSGSQTTLAAVYIKHRYGEVNGFTKRYHLNRLVWLEHFRDVNDAIACEKKLKGWRRSRKTTLIEQTNPRWRDLSDDWEQEPKVYARPWTAEEMI